MFMQTEPEPSATDKAVSHPPATEVEQGQHEEHESVSGEAVSDKPSSAASDADTALTAQFISS